MNFIFTAFHHDQGRRQGVEGATAIIEFFSVTHTSKKIEGARSACVRRRHQGTMVQAWRSGCLCGVSCLSVYCRAVLLEAQLNVRGNQLRYKYYFKKSIIGHVQKVTHKTATRNRQHHLQLQ